jgi:SNF2 family DNA or RNA helicase
MPAKCGKNTSAKTTPGIVSDESSAAPPALSVSATSLPATTEVPLVATAPASNTTTRKRSRSAATAPSPHIDVEVESSIASMHSDTSAAITVEDDALPTPAAQSGAGRSRQHQTTLTGGVANTPGTALRTRRAKAHRDDNAIPSLEQSTGGELKPSSSPTCAGGVKRQGGRHERDTAANAVDDATAAPVLEKALLAHLRNALTLYACRQWKRTIGLTTVPSAAQRADAMGAYAASETALSGETGEPPVSPSVSAVSVDTMDEVTPRHTDEDEDEDEDDNDAVEREPAHTTAETAEAAVDAEQQRSPSAPGTQGYLALPCVQYFIVHECARVARVVRDEGGNGYGDDPTVRALELLGLLLSMLDTPSCFAALLVLACPSCRSIGINADATMKVLEFLVLSQRAKWEDVVSLDQANMIDVLGLLGGCRDDAGVPVEPLRCCPYGEVHMEMQLLLIGAAHAHLAMHTCNLKYRLVPFEVGRFPAIAEAAKFYYRACEEHTTALEKALREKRLSPAMQVLAAKSRQRRRTTPPELPTAVAALLRRPAGGVTWAEEVFCHILPNTSLTTDSKHLNNRELHSRIRAVYAYTQTDAYSHGGYLDLALHTPGCYARGQGVVGLFTEADIIFLSHLFTFMKVFQHIAEALLYRGGDNDDYAQRCLCHPRVSPSSTSFLLMEDHAPYMKALRRCREEQYLLVDIREETAKVTLCHSQAVFDVDTGDEERKEREHGADGGGDNDGFVAAGNPAGVCGGVSYYAAGSFARFHATLGLTMQMNAGQVVDYVARVTADAAEPLPASVIPAQYIHATLKRHQLEDVQWMWIKETEGYREHVQVPLYYITFNGAVHRRPVVRAAGIMYYCATTREIVVERGATAQAAEWRTIGNVIHGGMLCDDVGLGKTLSILALCAYDRAVRESGTSVCGSADDGASPSLPNRFWQVSARNGDLRTQPLSFNTDVLRWGFGAGVFHAGTALYNTRPTPLPRTTLVVVPLSIASQWIDELHKFYPGASYILFYGPKRTQYSVHDLQRADFVLTTYETLSTHLRQETDGVRYWLSRCADVVDDRACLEAVKLGWSACRPSYLQAALHSFASSTVWPQLPSEADNLFLNFHRSRRFVLEVHQHFREGVLRQPLQQQQQRRRGRAAHARDRRRDDRGGQEQRSTSMQNNEVPPPRKLDAWKFDYRTPQGFPCFSSPAFNIYVTASGEHTLSDLEHQPTRSAVYRRLCTEGACPVSDMFLDGVWEVLKEYATAVGAATVSSRSLQACLFDFTLSENCTETVLTLLFRAEARYPMSDTIRRSFVRHVLLPPLWTLFEKYVAEMRPHYAAVASAELTGRMPLRILDLLFHRVVLDESQKCGSSSLFHLLMGERRWAVTGTPLNNNKTESLAAALAFLGMSSAAQLLSRPAQRSIYYVSNWISRHTSPYSPYMKLMLNRVINRTDTRIRARLHLPFRSDAACPDVQFCLCAACTQGSVYGVVEGADAVIPLECRSRQNERQYPSGLPCLPNTLMEILALTMVRHERNQQLSRELQLPPVRYRAHLAELGADEMQLYDRIAQVIMRFAAQLHRQGLLSSRMGYALQWVQELCRLCLHPSRVGDVELLRGDIEAHVWRAVHFEWNERNPDSEGFATSVAATFINVTAQEALEWVQSLASRAADRATTTLTVTATDRSSVNTHLVPEETVSALNDLNADPPVLPMCGICMDDMVAPTLLNCFHMFCKECVIGVIDASLSYAGNVNAKCPFCRNKKSLLEEKRVITVVNAQAMAEEPAAPTPSQEGTPQPDTAAMVDIDATLARIGDGNRVRAFVALVKEIWDEDPGDGVLVFSKYPALLQMAHDAIQAAGYAPYMVRGGSTLAQRQRVMRALQQPGGAAPVPNRILFVTSRSANAGLNLTFANHVIFLEPNLNPAMEQQAIGRVHRFGQLKQVVVHHLYAPCTIEQVIYHRSVRLRGPAAQHPPANGPEVPVAIQNVNEMQRRTQFGRIAPTEILLLLEYPAPPQQPV